MSFNRKSYKYERSSSTRAAHSEGVSKQTHKWVRQIGSLPGTASGHQSALPTEQTSRLVPVGSNPSNNTQAPITPVPKSQLQPSQSKLNAFKLQPSRPRQIFGGNQRPKVPLQRPQGSQAGKRSFTWRAPSTSQGVSTTITDKTHQVDVLKLTEALLPSQPKSCPPVSYLSQEGKIQQSGADAAHLMPGEISKLDLTEGQIAECEPAGIEDIRREPSGNGLGVQENLTDVLPQVASNAEATGLHVEGAELHVPQQAPGTHSDRERGETALSEKASRSPDSISDVRTSCQPEAIVLPQSSRAGSGPNPVSSEGFESAIVDQAGRSAARKVLSASGSLQAERLPSSAPHQKAVPKAAISATTDRTPAGFKRQGKHRLIRRSSIVTAAARTLSAVKASPKLTVTSKPATAKLEQKRAVVAKQISSQRATGKSLQWNRVATQAKSLPNPGVDSHLGQDAQLPGRKPGTLGQMGGPAVFKWSRPGAERQSNASVAKSGALAQHAKGLQRSKFGSHTRVTQPKKVNLKPGKQTQLRPTTKGLKRPSQSRKLVRVGDDLYRVGRNGASRSLKRQSVPTLDPAAMKQAAKAKSQYQRKGNALHRLLTGTPMKSPLAAATAYKHHTFTVPAFRGVFSGAATRSSLALGSLNSDKVFRHSSVARIGGSSLSSGAQAAGQQVRSPAGAAVKRTSTKPTGILAQIRKRSKFVNQVCTEYCRTGRCALREKGHCQKVHDPSKVAVCPQWLNDQCRNPSCKLQHVRREDLMPTCIHFLRGSCSSTNCPFLHVNMEKNAEVCQDFLDGFCAKGKSCPKKHLTQRMLQDLQQASKKTNKVKPMRRVFKRGSAQSSAKPKSPKGKAKAELPVQTSVPNIREQNLMLPAFLRMPQ